MKKPLLLFGLLAFAGTLAAQSVGIEVGKVLAVDRDAQLLLLTDRSVWSLNGVGDELRDELAAGDRVEFSYKKSAEGPSAVIDIEITQHASETGGIDIAEGIVLAYDRRARLLILADKSAWPLGGLDPAPPPGLGAGDRVHIEYRPGKDGGITVEDLIVIFR